MKKNFLLFSLLSVFSLQMFAQTVPQEQRTLITKVTASWCGNCGTWGWTLFEGLVEDNPDKAVLIANHYSGDLSNTTSDEIAENWNVNSQPRFLTGNDDQSVLSSNIDAKRTAIKGIVDANFMSMPLANAGIEASITGDQLMINTKTQFFQPTTGEYYLGVYIVENGVINNQSGQGANAVHKKIMRGAVTSTTFGDLLMNGSIGMNMEFDKSFTMTVDSGWDINNLEVVTIIWQKENDDYSFINTNMVSEITETTSISNVLLEGASIKVSPNVISSEAIVSIELENELKDATLQVFDLQGRKILDVYQGDLTSGNTTFTINKNSKTNNGIYFLTLQSNEKVVSQKIIFQ